MAKKKDNGNSPRLDLTGKAGVLAIRLAATLPLWLNQALGDWLGRLAWWFPSRMKEVTRRNLAVCFPDKDEHWRRRVARQSLRETGRTSMMFTLLWTHPDRYVPQLIRGVEGAEALQATVDEGRPVLLLAPHLGCWELANYWVSGHYPLHILYKPSIHPALNKLVSDAREHFQSTAYPTTPRGIAGLVRALRKGGMTGILPDQVPETDAGGIHSDFFGRPALSSTLSNKLIRQTGARAFMIYARRLPEGGYQVILRDPDPAIYSDDLQTSVDALNRSTEALIREVPEQYQWSYKRFKKEPKGMKHLYH